MTRMFRSGRYALALTVCLCLVLIAWMRYGRFSQKTGDPILDLELSPNRASVLLLRDRLRARIGRWNHDNISVSSDDALFDSLDRRAPPRSASCGPIALALEAVLERRGIEARLVHFYYVDGSRCGTHTATEVSLDGRKSWFVVDAHAGVVWQDRTGKLVSAVDVGKQALVHGTNFLKWDVYPSSHGGLYRGNRANFARALLFMALYPETFPRLIAAVAMMKPTGKQNTFAIEELVVFRKQDAALVVDTLRRQGVAIPADVVRIVER